MWFHINIQEYLLFVKTGDKTFTKNFIKNHKALMHGKMHLQCQYCPKRFSMKHNLDHHIKDRHIKPHKCNICEKGFGSEWMLEKHKNVTHLGLKPHVCNLCHEGFGELNKLNRHKQLYHSKGRKISMPQQIQIFVASEF